MTVVLSMNAVFNNHQLIRGDETMSSRDVPSFPLVPALTTSRRSTDPAVVSPSAVQEGSSSKAQERIEKPMEEAQNNVVADDDGDTRGSKRKLESKDTADDVDHVPCKRISPFLNTPKQRKEERRKVLKLSIQKLKQMEDPENFLRRSVLINNTVKKMQKELRDEKRSCYVPSENRNYSLYKRRPSFDYDVFGSGYLCSSNSHMFDEPAPTDESDRITDDMTDTLVHSLEGNFSCDAALTPGPLETFSSESQKQIFSDMDAVFNNLIRALGET
ncbi:SERTA domain-containing protein 4-like [Gigantopelta aegis]|uniref:SERTA domain-containing protein 4-like n=1 Tax=Gigantopelta aegis TaxID=1735272 RepID=UPI001B887BD4|nr:SERTA domain-containing protein 4-like [Gigantopelta aegis]XP_041353763.1 SERTA domain-containing protein 4-like [Gigantopelta aegis]XP_041353764.1 SERTA domain-containing protein 4-like [Gigantopelta aegis]XP_041353765.1 SERTA domain-containing protein 4-like [Gigantopelta aegis]XP_041353766.1 SERTA domain-containing protein 4-like [Gigantopelta aegis]